MPLRGRVAARQQEAVARRGSRRRSRSSSPLTTYSSPSRSARVRSATRSEPAFGLREALTPEGVASRDARQVLALLRLAAVLHDRRADPVDVHVLRAARLAARPQLLAEDRVLPGAARRARRTPRASAASASRARRARAQKPRAKAAWASLPGPSFASSSQSGGQRLVEERPSSPRKASVLGDQSNSIGGLLRDLTVRQISAGMLAKRAARGRCRESLAPASAARPACKQARLRGLRGRRDLEVVDRVPPIVACIGDRPAQRAAPPPDGSSSSNLRSSFDEGEAAAELPGPMAGTRAAGSRSSRRRS